MLHYKQYSHQPWLPNKDGQLLAGEQMLLVSIFFLHFALFLFLVDNDCGENRGKRLYRDITAINNPLSH